MLPDPESIARLLAVSVVFCPAPFGPNDRVQFASCDIARKIVGEVIPARSATRVSRRDPRVSH